MSANEEHVGYGKPPRRHRFKKGRSGNPAGRPPKKRLPNDMRSMLERVANETIEVGGEEMTMLEIELRTLQRKAAKGDITASRHLAKMRNDAGVGQQKMGGGVLLLPAPVPLEEWTAAVAIQQAQFRERPAFEREEGD